MIIVLKNNSQEKQVEELLNWLDQFHVSTNLVEGVHSNVIGLIGDTTQIDIEAVQAKECVENVQRVQEPYKNANRKFHPDNTVIDVAGRKIGGGKLQVIAGPCSVETEEQIITTAIAVKEAGATMLRGGAFKPRTSPYSFQGLGKEGIDLLIQARKITGLPIVTEIMDLSDLDCFADVDVVQVGARNMAFRRGGAAYIASATAGRASEKSFLSASGNRKRVDGGGRQRAMGHAIANTFKSVAGSSVTTVAGFLALCVMTFALGRDLGIVMAKGVLIGVVCCVTVLPAMVLVFDKAIEKTRHKPLVKSLDKPSAFITKHYKVWVVIFLVLLFPSIYGTCYDLAAP